VFSLVSAKVYLDAQTQFLTTRCPAVAKVSVAARVLLASPLCSLPCTMCYFLPQKYSEYGRVLIGSGLPLLKLSITI
jgi:hypothetical protein